MALTVIPAGLNQSGKIICLTLLIFALNKIVFRQSILAFHGTFMVKLIRQQRFDFVYFLIPTGADYEKIILCLCEKHIIFMVVVTI